MSTAAEDTDAPAAEEPGATAVPHPNELRIVIVLAQGQQMDEEQRERVCAWFRSNQIDPKVVSIMEPVTIEYRFHPRASSALIRFHQHYVNDEGHRESHPITHEAVRFERVVPMRVPLPPQPESA